MKFCTSCQSMRVKDGGTIKKTKSGSRWQCGQCFAHQSEPLYKAGSTRESDIKKLRYTLYQRTMR